MKINNPLPSTERLQQTNDQGQRLSIEELHLTVVDGPLRGTDVACGTRTVRIGTAPDNDLVVQDTTVSRYHAILEPSGGRLLLKDLGSTNGTFVGDSQIREVFLRPGICIRIGRTTLRLALKARHAMLLPSCSDRFGHLVGSSLKMRQLFTLLEWVAPTQITMLVTGPTGTGKELVARSVHDACTVRTGAFVVLDCGAADPGIISSELFGHESGAFTGASNRRIGVFEQARGGTVFIDEVGELPIDLQPKLLRVLESREIRRLGGNQVIPVDVRVIAATNRDLEQMVVRGTFRKDLYYRLCQVKIDIPSLERRMDDLPLLIQAILERMPRPAGPLSVRSDVVEFLRGCSFPGNVRQLKNLLERAAQVARGPVIEMVDLLLSPEELEQLGEHAFSEIVEPRMDSRPENGPLPPDEEKARLVAALDEHEGNLSQTAKALGVALNTLKSRMKKLGLPRPWRSNGLSKPGQD